MERIKVQVTAEDIKDGLPHRCSQCPIALAIKRGHNINDVQVAPFGHTELLFATVNGHSRPLPPGAAQFVRDFDAGRDVSPFEFDL